MGFRQADTRNARTLDDLIGGIVTGPQSGMDVNEYVGPETGVAGISLEGRDSRKM